MISEFGPKFPDYRSNNGHRGGSPENGSKEKIKYKKRIEELTTIIESKPDSKIDPKSKKLYYERALNYHLLGEYDKAIADLNLVIKLDPQDNEMYYERASAYIDKSFRLSKQGDNINAIDCLNQAIADLNIAVQFNPEYIAAHDTLEWAHGEKASLLEKMAKLLEERGKEEEYEYYKKMADQEHRRAIFHITRVIELNPNHVKAYRIRALHLSIIGELEKALDDYTKAIELNPNNPDIYCGRALAYWKMDEIDLAIADLNVAIEMNPNNPRFYHIRGNIYKEIGEDEKAEEDFRKRDELEKKKEG